MALRPLVPIIKNQKAIKISGWQELPEEELEKLVAANNGGNIGVRLDHYAVIDPDEPAAEIFANEWEKKGILPPTVAWKTARGFTKRLYKRPANWPFESNTANMHNLKIQLRSGSGVQDVIPPSYVVDKIKKFEGRYTWIPGRDPDSMEPADLPQEILVHFLMHSQAAKPIASPTGKPFTGDRLDVETYLSNYGIELVKIKPFKGGHLFCLRKCIFNPDDHVPNDAAIFQAEDGKLSYQCFHDTCKGRTWHEAKTLISGEERITKTKERAGTNNYTNTTSIGQDKKGLLAALRENKLTVSQKTYLIKLIEQSDTEKSISDRVRDYVFGTEEDINRTNTVKNMGLWDNLGHREAAFKALTRLKDEGIITGTGRRGYYRRVEGEAEKINFLEADPNNYWKIVWPFRLHQLVKIFPRNLIVIAGSTNAGKTAFLLEFCRLNMNMKRKNIRYISTEMDPVELRQRLDYYATDMGELNVSLHDWEDKIDFRFRSEKIIDIIQPNRINIVDYYSAEGEFYDIDREFKEINKKLDKGIAIIAIQKKPDAQTGYGGPLTEFLPRLALNIDRGKITIKKAKNIMPGINRGADGVVIPFKLAQGYKWQPQSIDKLFWWWNYHDKESETLAF